MSVLAHANHPETFVAGLAVGALVVVAAILWNRTKAKK
jgi:hypothetical protein